MRNYEEYTLDDGSSITEQEQWILEQVLNGRVANLKEKYDDSEEKRILRGGFLKKLILNEFKEKMLIFGVRIAFGIIKDDLVLEFAEVNNILALENFDFFSVVKLIDAKFKTNLIMRNSHFHDFALFGRMRVDENVSFDGSIFETYVDFSWVEVGHQFALNETQFKEKSFANCQCLIVKDSIFFNNAIFDGLADFSHAKIARNFEASGIRFNNYNKTIKFHGITIGESLVIRNSVSSSSLDFSRAAINGDFNSTWAHYKNDVIFNGVEIHRQVSFVEATFRGKVDFTGAKIHGQFLATGTHFANKEAIFSGIMVLNGAIFNCSVFEGIVDFSNAEIVKQLWFDYSEFYNVVSMSGSTIKGNFLAEKTYFANEVSFNGIKVYWEFSLNDSVFDGRVDFVGSEIGKQFKAFRVQFNNAHDKVIFDLTKVDRTAFLIDVIYNGGVSLNDCYFFDLRLESGEIGELEIERTKVERELVIEDIKIDNFKANNLHVKVRATFKNIIINNDANLRFAKFGIFEMVDVDWPLNKECNDIEGFTYETISTGDAKTNLDTLLKWLAGTTFNSQAYSQLESHFQLTGLEKSANKLFIERKRREVNQLPAWKKWPMKFLWGGLAGYGRKPYLVIPWILLFIVLGAWTFSPTFEAKDMAYNGYLKQMAIGYPWTTKFVLSLDRLLPGVDLGVSKHWAPASACWWIWIYWHVQKLLGWILIPIGLAAIYTRLK